MSFAGFYIKLIKFTLMRNKNIASLILLLSISIFSTGITYLQKINLNKIQSQDKQNYFQEETSLRATLNIQKKIPSFGLSNLVANWNLLQFIQYFGDGEAREQTGYSLVPDYFEIIVNHDPRFIKAHLIISSANSIYAGQPHKTVAFLDKSLQFISPENFPYASYIWTYKGVDELLFLGNTKAAQNSYKTAAKWAEMRGDKIGKQIAARNRETANFLATNPDSTKAQISAWSMILSNASDEKTRSYALEQLKNLGAKISIN